MCEAQPTSCRAHVVVFAAASAPSGPPLPPWRRRKALPPPPSPPRPLPSSSQVIYSSSLNNSSSPTRVEHRPLLPHRRTCPAGLLFRRKCGRLAARVRELEAALAAAAEKAASERRGRVRAQQVGVEPPTCRAFRLCALPLLSVSCCLFAESRLLLAVVEEGSERAGAPLRRGDGQGR